MTLAGMSFEEGVRQAIDTILEAGLELVHLNAEIKGRVVTLFGVAGSDEARLRVIRKFNELIETEHTINRIRVEKPSLAGGGHSTAAKTGTIKSERVSPHTIAREYYGKAALYPRIFNADRDILDDPALVKAGKKLRVDKQR